MCYADDTMTALCLVSPSDGFAEYELGSNKLLVFEWHKRRNPKNTKPMVVSRSRTYAPGYGDITLGSAELEEVKSLHILGVTLDSKLIFQTHLHEILS